jgi:hypothetical protein
VSAAPGSPLELTRDPGGSPTPLPSDISPTLAQRLRAEGISTCQDWVALKGRRRLIFGVSAAAVRQIDEAVRAMLGRARA